MSKDDWVIVIASYMDYCTSDNKMKSSELDEFFMLNNSFKSVFSASKEFEVS